MKKIPNKLVAGLAFDWVLDESTLNGVDPKLSGPVVVVVVVFCCKPNENGLVVVEVVVDGELFEPKLNGTLVGDSFDLVAGWPNENKPDPDGLLADVVGAVVTWVAPGFKVPQHIHFVSSFLFGA